jgi:phospholipase/carboxylesterase
MIVALHGLGDNPESFGTIFDDFGRPARIIVPRAPTPYHGGYSWFSFDRSNEAETARGLEQAAVRVAALIRWLSAREPPAGKAIVTGFSQGGMLSFVLAVRHPDLVAEAFPVSGSLPRALFPTKADHAPPRIVALHGDEDVRVPLGPTREGVEVLNERGYRAELRVYPGVGHSISRSERVEWMELLRDACARVRSRASSGR